MVKGEALEAVLAAFEADETAKVIAKRVGVTPNTLQRIWEKQFGVDAVRARGARQRKGAPEDAREEALEAFHTAEGFKDLAKRLGMSPNTLRALWYEKYGKEAVTERGTKLRKAGAVAFGVRTRGVPKTKNIVEVPCSTCREPVLLTRLQQSKTETPLCVACDAKQRNTDRECPVCGLACVGVKGLASHLARAEDPLHEEYTRQQEDLRWGGLHEGKDFVVCQVCQFKAQSLNNHLKLHELTAEQYREQFPGKSVLCAVTGARLSRSLSDAYSRAPKYVFTREDLLAFADDEGKVVVAAVCAAHRCVGETVIRYCRKLGLPTRNKLAWQKVVLDQAAQFLGEPYEWKWSDLRIVSLTSGRKLNFDGYFEKSNLIIEAHGEQHYRYSEKWHGTAEEFYRQQSRDTYKRACAEQLGYTVKVIRESDPIFEPSFWQALLSGDVSQWDNMSEEAKQAKCLQVLSEVRAQGWPRLEPRPTQYVRAEMARLSTFETHEDEDHAIRPYSVRGVGVCASFFPHRYDATYRDAMSARQAWDDDDKLLKAIRLQLDSGHPTTPQRVLKALVLYHRTPSVFRPAVAKHVYQRFARGGRVWDPCAGYGGRLFGAVAAGVQEYIGTDIEPETVRGNIRLAEALGQSARCQVECSAVETFEPPRGLDLVFTSPPYYDLEVYGAASRQALQTHASPEEWVATFLGALINKAASALKDRGHLVLNLPMRPIRGIRLDKAASILAGRAGLIQLPALRLPVRSFQGRQKSEPLLVWVK